MTIEKLPATSIIGNTQNHGQLILPISLIQKIKNGDAFLVFTYLKTLDVMPTKVHLCEHFGFGKQKLNQIFAYLKRANLIDYQCERENGQFSSRKTVLLTPEKFNPVI